MRTAEFFAAVVAMLRRGGGVLDQALIGDEFRAEFVLAGGPPVIQSCALAVLARIARWSGREAGLLGG